MPASGQKTYIQKAVKLCAGSALAKLLEGFIPKPLIGPAITTLVNTSIAANTLVYFFIRSLADVFNTIVIMINEMNSSQKAAFINGTFLPGTVTT